MFIGSRYILFSRNAFIIFPSEMYAHQQITNNPFCYFAKSVFMCETSLLTSINDNFWELVNRKTIISFDGYET
jgi:hypothetical protein